MEVNAEIVVSSSRRKTKTLQELRLIFVNRGIGIENLSLMPVFEDATNRKEELILFLAQENPARYLIIDDDLLLHEFSPEIKQNCVLTTSARGFDEEALMLAQKILKQ